HNTNGVDCCSPGKLSNISGVKTSSSNISNGTDAVAVRGSMPVRSEATPDPGAGCADGFTRPSNTIDVAPVSPTFESRPVSFCPRARNLATLVVNLMGLEMYTTLTVFFLPLPCLGLLVWWTPSLPMVYGEQN
ncbi:unnamed protein product, partial [Musa textilis]